MSNIGIIGGADGPTAVYVASTAVSPLEPLLFSLILALLLLHEMDAIRVKEWNMFIILKDMPEEAAYKAFALIHLPLYIIAFYILSHGGVVADYILKILIDVFLICHVVIHYAFRKHSENGFHSRFSVIIIAVMSTLALAHLCLFAL